MRNPDNTEPMADTVSRRGFVKLTSAGGAGLMLGLQLTGCAPGAEAVEGDSDGDSLHQQTPGAAAVPFAPNAFVRITPNNQISVVVRYQEMGQGTATGVATLVAEELDADWTKVSVEYAPSAPAVYANPLYGIQGTGGSTAMRGAWNQMRQAGAAARLMLVNAAAASWKVRPAELRVANSTITHISGRRATFGQLASLAAQQPVPAPADIKLKDPSTFKLIGKPITQRVDQRSKCNGTAQYTADVKLPGMLTAVIARPPTFSAKLVSYNEAAAKAVKGVTDVVKVPEGIAVVATGMYPAIKGRNALKAQWDTSADANLSSEQILADYRMLSTTPGSSVTKSEGTTAALAGAAKTIEAVFEFPYLAHAPMEPLNCVAWLHDGIIETWGAHQLQTIDHQNAAAAAGLGMDKVKLNTLMAGGSFGRRANVWADFTVEAINVAKAINGRAPVKVQRTREDDTRMGLYRPIYVHRVKAGLTTEGTIAGWQHTVVGQAIYQAGPALGPNSMGNDPTSVEGLWPTPYAIPNLSIDLHSPKQVVRPLWWRSVGHTHTAYAVETLLDELAEAAGKDPVDFRMALLATKPRNAATLQLLKEKSGWGTPAPAGIERGLVLHESFGSVVGMVADVSLNDDGTPKVHRVVVTVDCGIAINPDVIKAQMEGGLGFGLSAALFGEISIDKGNVEQNNFYDYRVLRIDEMPKVEVHIVPSASPPTGVGEIGVPPIAPAVANALYKLTKKRVRRLPFSRLATQA